MINPICIFDHVPKTINHEVINEFEDNGTKFIFLYCNGIKQPGFLFVAADSDKTWCLGGQLFKTKEEFKKALENKTSKP